MRRYREIMINHRRNILSSSDSFRLRQQLGIVNTLNSSSISDGRQRRSRGPIMTEDRWMSLLLVLVAVWFLYARFQESHAFAASQSGSQKNKQPVTTSYKAIGSHGFSSSKLDTAITNEETSPLIEPLYPSDDDETSRKYLRGRESGAGIYMPPGIKELLVQNGVDKGPPPHQRNINQYREIPPPAPGDDRIDAKEGLDKSGPS